MLPFRFLFFDLDGTLADTLGDIAVSVNLTLDRYGLPPLNLERVCSFVGQGPANLMRRSFQEQGSEPEAIDEAVTLFYKLYDEHLTDTTRLYPAVGETLASLSDHRKAVITNKPLAHAERILQRLGIRRNFETVIGYESLPQHKPSPEPILHVMREMQAAKEDVLMIGDALYDIESARNAGVRCAAALYGFQAREELLALKADYYLERFDDLITLLAGI
jgi:phosphoglycolate phosphatase